MKKKKTLEDYKAEGLALADEMDKLKAEKEKHPLKFLIKGGAIIRKMEKLAKEVDKNIVSEEKKSNSEE